MIKINDTFSVDLENPVKGKDYTLSKDGNTLRMKKSCSIVIGGTNAKVYAKECSQIFTSYSYVHIITEDNCQISTNRRCTIKAGKDCQIATAEECKIMTNHHCDIMTGGSCNIEVGSDCNIISFHPNSIITGHQCVLRLDNEYILKSDYGEIDLQST